MIQKVTDTSGNTASTSQPQNDLDIWGSWGPPSHYGRRYYSLEVIQNPVRARMCGFGDKDRRPLAPAAVCKMVVQKEDHSYCEVDEIDASFFLVCVDLWSADGKSEMNLVLHPTNSDRYIPSSAPKTKRRNTGTTAATGDNSVATTPTIASSCPYPTPAPTGITPYMQPPAPPSYSTTPYQYPAQPPPAEGYQTMSQYGSPETSTWGYGGAQQYSQPIVPSSQPMGRTTSSGSSSSTGVGYSTTTHTTSNQSWNVSSTREDDYRTWPQEHPYSSLEGAQGSSAIDPSLRAPPAQSTAADASAWSCSQPPYTSSSRYSQEPYGAVPQQSTPNQPQQLDTSVYASASYAQHEHQQQQTHAAQQAQPHYTQSTPYAAPPSPPPNTIPPLPRHTYTRTLVGPLASNAARLCDEHRKPGIFFLFQDLSIRTEGTFRLRMRLMNVGAPPAPDPGAYRVHTDVSPVLAQTFTEPFTVYSAKRFPGVPPTTALSIALGNQGQKLPLRNRNNKGGRKRQRNESGGEESGDESEDA